MKSIVLSASTSILRCILRAISVSIGFVLLIFAVASGQVTNTASEPGIAGTSGIARAMAVIAAEVPVPLYGIQPEYGVVQPKYGPVVKYGMPYATYVIKGRAKTAKDSIPIPNLRVTLRKKENGALLDTVRSDKNGSYSFSRTNAPWDSTWYMKIEDIDGKHNGEFQSADTLFSIPQNLLRGANGFFAGKADTTIDLYLEKKQNATPVTHGDREQIRALGFTVMIDGKSQPSVSFSLPADMHIMVTAYDARGTRLATIDRGPKSAGSHTAEWRTGGLATGYYYLQMATPRYAIAKKVFVP